MNCKIYNKGAMDIYNVKCKLETYFFVMCKNIKLY